MDACPRTPLISFCTVQLQTLCAAHSLVTLCLSTTSGPDPGELPSFWDSMVFCHAPIFQKGSGKQQHVCVIQFLSGVVPLAEMARFTPISSAIAHTPSLHLSRLRASSFKPIFSVSSSTCFFEVFFGHPRFLLPLTSRFRATLKTLSSSLLSTCPHHLTPFAVAKWSIFSFNPNISICSSVVFLSTTF